MYTHTCAQKLCSKAVSHQGTPPTQPPSSTRFRLGEVALDSSAGQHREVIFMAPKTLVKHRWDGGEEGRLPQPRKQYPTAAMAEPPLLSARPTGPHQEELPFWSHQRTCSNMVRRNPHRARGWTKLKEGFCSQDPDHTGRGGSQLQHSHWPLERNQALGLRSGWQLSQAGAEPLQAGVFSGTGLGQWLVKDRG